MAELLNTTINGTLNVNKYNENNEITNFFNIDDNGNLALKKNGFNLFSIDSDGLNLYIPSKNETEFNNANILNINTDDGMILNKGNITVIDGNVKTKTLSLFAECSIDTESADGVVNIKKPVTSPKFLTNKLDISDNNISAINSSNDVNINLDNNSFSITTKDNNKNKILLKQNSDELTIKNSSITNIETGYININSEKKLESFSIYGGNEDQIGVSSSANLSENDIIYLRGKKYIIRKVHLNPTLNLYGFTKTNFDDGISINPNPADSISSFSFPFYYDYKNCNIDDITFYDNINIVNEKISVTKNSAAYNIKENSDMDYLYFECKTTTTSGSFTRDELDKTCNSVLNDTDNKDINKFVTKYEIDQESAIIVTSKFILGEPLIKFIITTSNFKLLILDDEVPSDISKNEFIYKESSNGNKTVNINSDVNISNNLNINGTSSINDLSIEADEQGLKLYNKVKFVEYPLKLKPVSDAIKENKYVDSSGNKIDNDTGYIVENLDVRSRNIFINGTNYKSFISYKDVYKKIDKQLVLVNYDSKINELSNDLFSIGTLTLTESSTHPAVFRVITKLESSFNDIISLIFYPGNDPDNINSESLKIVININKNIYNEYDKYYFLTNFNSKKLMEIKKDDKYDLPSFYIPESAANGTYRLGHIFNELTYIINNVNTIIFTIPLYEKCTEIIFNYSVYSYNQNDKFLLYAPVIGRDILSVNPSKTASSNIVINSNGLIESKNKISGKELYDNGNRVYTSETFKPRLWKNTFNLFSAAGEYLILTIFYKEQIFYDNETGTFFCINSSGQKITPDIDSSYLIDASGYIKKDGDSVYIGQACLRKSNNGKLSLSCLPVNSITWSTINLKGNFIVNKNSSSSIDIFEYLNIF